jgi:DNA-binding NarL/FixJ family response regulator
VTTAKRPRVLVADDHALVSAGISKLLENDCELVGTVSDGRALISAARDYNPDVILLDISMPILNGLEAARQVRQEWPQAKLIFVTVHSDTPYVIQAFRAGASGYVLKRSAAAELVTAVHKVLDNKVYLTPLIRSSAVDDFFKTPSTQAPILSKRQREVLQLVAEGHSAKEIAQNLRISSKTVEFHKGLIMKKLDLHSTAELTRYAIENGISAS